jgi:4-hydroxybenzoate polyprenyltransferase
MIQQARLLIVSMRPRQWLKNGLVFAGLIFAEMAGRPELLFNTLQAFVIFCLLSGSVYLLNDLLDIKQDRQHPEKRRRPLAAGQLPPQTAWAALCVAGIGSLIWAFTVTEAFGWCAVAYLAMQAAYSLKLKHVVIVDLLILALGFVLRAYAGIAAINVADLDQPVEATPWFLACTLFLALFIGICKRRHEIGLLQEGANQHREVLEEYSKPFLDQMVAVATSSTILTYALYALSHPEHEGIIFTLPFVLYGVFRYLYLVYQKNQGGAPETTVLRDTTMVINVLLWLAAMIYLFYYHMTSAK